MKHKHGHHLSHERAEEMEHMKKKHHKKKHHSDPIVGGTSEDESRPWGHGEYANMPQEVRMQEYPKMGYQAVEGIDDTAGRIEQDAKYDVRGNRKNLDRGMY